jgi:type III restriction enzyme
MKLKFDPNQDFQIQAVESVVNLFEGQPYIAPDLSFELGGNLAAVANRFELDENTLLANLNTVQETNELEGDAALEYLEETANTAAGEQAVRFYNFTVEMETGTGKTYVYIRTALELYRRYGFRKFIIVVPSIAIREGVFKTFQITEDHFKRLFENIPYKYYAYKSANLSQVRQFALSNSVEFMVMTIDSFNKELNVIRQSTDRLQGEVPIHLVQATRPILILDEPQNMESERSVAALANLNPLFALRYSATHRKHYNLVYRLTPYDAYRQGLVKRIEVASIIQKDDENRPYIKLLNVKTAKKTLTAKLEVHKLKSNGTVNEKVVTVKPGDDLQDITNRVEYEGYVVDEINIASKSVRFSNDAELSAGDSVGADKEAIFDAQIRTTIEEHFRKQKAFADRGIKVLSLFFIDRVANYADEDGKIKVFFDQAFDEIKTEFPAWKGRKPEDVRAAYFAQRKTKEGDIILYNTFGESQKDEEAYDLIMKDKERLLSFDEPVSFIFSHSALREGWDNPNVFQICTLNQTISDMKKRQEIGRGVRLVVNQEGERIRDENVNVLTVVANESYERYVATLQREIEDEYGPDGTPPKPVNARKRAKARLRKEYKLKPEFKGLWDRIKHKTRYAVKIDTDRLVKEIIPTIDKLEIKKPRLILVKGTVGLPDEGAVFTGLQSTGERTIVDRSGAYPLPNIVETMATLLEHTTPPVRLTRKTLLEIVKRTSNKEGLRKNPYEFATETVKVIKLKLAEFLVEGIQYEKIDEFYEMSQFEAEIDKWDNYLVRADKSLYDHVIYESETEKEFAKGLENRDDVILYVKLPDWFTVPTPVGEYNPDWAIVMKNHDNDKGDSGKPLLYLVRETKSGEMRPTEERKTICGGRHFKDALGVDYKVVTSTNELP